MAAQPMVEHVVLDAPISRLAIRLHFPTAPEVDRRGRVVADAREAKVTIHAGLGTHPCTVVEPADLIRLAAAAKAAAVWMETVGTDTEVPGQMTLDEAVTA